MHIKVIHEDADLFEPARDGALNINVFNFNDLPVGRTNDQIFFITKLPFRIAEKAKNKNRDRG